MPSKNGSRMLPKSLSQKMRLNLKFASLNWEAQLETLKECLLLKHSDSFNSESVMTVFVVFMYH